MDPVNQTNTTTQGTTTPQPTSATDANVVIAGAFGGTLPTKPIVSDTMPAFSFDQDDFGVTNNSTIPPTPHYENITDPFAGGIVSTTSNPILSDATIVDNTVPAKDITIEEKLPEGTVSLDSLEETKSEETLPTQIQEISIPVEKVIEEVKIETTIENIEPSNNTDDSLPKISESQDISFDLPSQPDATHTQGVKSEETNTTVVNNETITPESPVVEVSEESLSMPIQEIPLPVKETIEEVKDETTETTEPSINTDDSLPTVSVSETRNKDSHDLQEVYDEFKQSFKEYSTFKGSLSISLVGLRTQEDEVTYTFTQTKDNNISIIKSNTTDILSFEETESGLKVSLNSDPLGYYGVDQVDVDTTHFLKEKLGKFTMMLQSEYEREEKKQREGLKKTRESLRSF